MDGRYFRQAAKNGTRAACAPRSTIGIQLIKGAK